jgi:hypothetical protein
MGASPRVVRPGPSRVRRAVGGWVAALVALVATALPVVAAPEDVCASLAAALQSVEQQIDQHNAQPHDFEIPDQAAAAAAYDAEAAELNAAQATALANVNECLEAMSTLVADNPAVSLDPPTDAVRQNLLNAQAKIPNEWVPPPSPAAGKNWRVPKGTPPRELYDLLRAGNPRQLGTTALQGTPRPAVGATDPAYPGRSFGTAAGGLSAASPDHIITIAEQISMPGFVKLTPDGMYVVTRAPLNFQWLSFKANLSKSSRSAAAMSGVDPRWQAQQVQLEADVRAQLQEVIDKLLRSQGTAP